MTLLLLGLPAPLLGLCCPPERFFTLRAASLPVKQAVEAHAELVTVRVARPPAGRRSRDRSVCMYGGIGGLLRMLSRNGVVCDLILSEHRAPRHGQLSVLEGLALVLRTASGAGTAQRPPTTLLLRRVQLSDHLRYALPAAVVKDTAEEVARCIAQWTTTRELDIRQLTPNSGAFSAQAITRLGKSTCLEKLHLPVPYTGKQCIGVSLRALSSVTCLGLLIPEDAAYGETDGYIVARSLPANLREVRLSAQYGERAQPGPFLRSVLAYWSPDGVGSLRALSLRGCALKGLRAAAWVSKSLAQFRAGLCSLDVGENSFGPDGLCLLAQELASHERLRRVSFAGDQGAARATRHRALQVGALPALSSVPGWWAPGGPTGCARGQLGHELFELFRTWAVLASVDLHGLRYETVRAIPAEFAVASGGVCVVEPCREYLPPESLGRVFSVCELREGASARMHGRPVFFGALHGWCPFLLRCHRPPESVRSHAGPPLSQASRGCFGH